jgi:hypothetical protein
VNDQFEKENDRWKRHFIAEQKRAEELIEAMRDRAFGKGVERHNDVMWPAFSSLADLIRFCAEMGFRSRFDLHQMYLAVTQARQLCKEEVTKARDEIAKAEPETIRRISRSTADAVAKAVETQLTRHADLQEKKQRWNLALSLFAAGLIMFGLGWACNTRATEDAVYRLNDSIGREALRNGMEQGEFWRDIIMWNDNAAALEISRSSCDQPSHYQQDKTGRRFCYMPLWLAAPPPPPQTDGPPQ